MAGFQDFFFKDKSSEVSTASTEHLVDELEKRQGATNLFPLDVFHPRIKPFIQELHTKFDIPRAYVGLSMILTYSSAVGNAYAVSRNGSDRNTLSVWGCMNGISSSGKSLALDMCLKPLSDIQNEMDEEWDEMTNGITDERRQGLKIKTAIYRDAHIPTLIRSIMPYNHKGVLKESDEILEWINGLNALGKKESTDEQFWISAWDGKKYSAIRSANNKINIPRVFTNVVGGIQPNLLYKLFKNDRDHSGFIFRLLFALPEKYKIARPLHGYDIPIEFKEVHKKCIYRLYKGLPVTDAYQEPKLCIVTPEAFKIMAEWEDKKIDMINSIPDLRERSIHSGILGKMKNYVYRFAGLFRITDWAYELEDRNFNAENPNDFFPDELKITRTEIKRAIRVANYFYQSAVDVYESVDKSITAPMNILQLATLFRMGKSHSEMAELILGDKKKKSTIHRMIKKAIIDYPKIFGAVNHNQ